MSSTFLVSLSNWSFPLFHGSVVEKLAPRLIRALIMNSVKYIQLGHVNISKLKEEVRRTYFLQHIQIFETDFSENFNSNLS